MKIAAPHDREKPKSSAPRRAASDDQKGGSAAKESGNELPHSKAARDPALVAATNPQSKI